MKRASIGINALINVIRSAFNVLYPIISYMYASRILGVDNIGRFNTANSLSQYVIFIANLGITNYIVREGSKIRDDREKISKLFNEILIITLGAMCLAYTVMAGLLMFPSIAPYRTLLVLLCTTVIFNTLGVEWLFQIYEDYIYITIRSIIFKVLSLLLLFLFVRTEGDLIVYTVIIVIGKVGANVLNFFKVPKYISIYRLGRKLEIKKHIKPILVMFGIAMSGKIYVNLDQTMVGLISGDYEAGLYANALQINEGVETLILAICMVASPRMSYYLANRGKENFEELAYKTMRYVQFFAVPLAVWVFLLSKESVLILGGAEFIGATDICQLLSFRILLGPLNYVLSSQILLTLDREKESLLATIVAALLNLILNYFLIFQFGGKGAAFTTILSELVVLFLCCAFLRKTFDIKKLLGNTLIYLLACIPSVLISKIILLFPLQMIFQCVLICFVSGMVYIGILFIVKEEITQNLFGVIKRKIKK